MKANGDEIGFELSLSARDDGTLEAAYIHIRRGKAKRTQEMIEDTLLADYDEQDRLIGIEILAPVSLSELAELVEQPRRTSFRNFVEKAAPAEFVHA